jgi:hypothetical protein
MRVFLATSMEEVRDIAAPGYRNEHRIGHRVMTKCRGALCWLKKFLRVAKFDRAVARIAVAVKKLARLSSRPPPPRKLPELSLSLDGGCSLDASVLPVHMP